MYYMQASYLVAVPDGFSRLVISLVENYGGTHIQLDMDTKEVGGLSQTEKNVKTTELKIPRRHNIHKGKRPRNGRKRLKESLQGEEAADPIDSRGT